jgi:CheY-like chemotaxis protein
MTLIAITGYGHEEAREQAWGAGFNHYLVKPVTIAQLLPLLVATP